MPSKIAKLGESQTRPGKRPPKAPGGRLNREARDDARVIREAIERPRKASRKTKPV
jgi:hypothetical protein